MDTPQLRHELFINTILLGGTPVEKAAAAAAAGFDRIELWTHDLDAFGGTPEDLGAEFAARSVGVLDFQVLRDFDGATDAAREGKRAEALHHLDLAVRLGAPMVLVAASTDPDSQADRIVDDLRWLAERARERGLRVAYESLAWSTRSTTLVEAWARVREADRENLGIVIDPFHVFVHGRTADDLEGIPADRVFLVQLSDLPHTVTPDVVIETARHHRLLPGEGTFDLRSVLVRLLRDGYDGPIGIEVFNDVMKASDPVLVAQRAMLALRSVLHSAMETSSAEGVA